MFLYMYYILCIFRVFCVNRPTSSVWLIYRYSYSTTFTNTQTHKHTMDNSTNLSLQPITMLDMNDMEPHLEGTELKGGIRGGGSLTMIKNGVVVGVLPANMLTSTVHKAQRRARKSAPLLDLLLQSMAYGVLKRLLANPKDASAKAALTQVLNRFAISFLEEGVLMACKVETAHAVVFKLKKMFETVNDMMFYINKIKSEDSSAKNQTWRCLAIGHAINLRISVHKLVAIVSNTPRARFISILGADATDGDRPQGVEPLPEPLSHLHDWKQEITETPYKNKQTQATFECSIEKMCQGLSWNNDRSVEIVRQLCSMPIKHNEYASMVWKYVFLETQVGPDLFRSQADAFVDSTPAYTGDQAGLPEGFETLEQVIDAFGIKDKHTGQGSFEEFVHKGSLVLQEPSDMIVFGHPIHWWRDRYVRLRTHVVPDTLKRKRETPKVENMQSPMALFAQKFNNNYVPQLPTGKHKARVLLHYDPACNQLTGRATKVFYSRDSYRKTRMQYEMFKGGFPSMVNDWVFNDDILTIEFPPLPGTNPIVPVEGESYTILDSFFDTKLKVVDVSKFGYTVLKVKSHVDPRVLASPRLMIDFITSIVLQRAIGITDVGPRQFLCIEDIDRAQDDGDPFPVTQLMAIDMSDGATYDDATREWLFRGDTLTEAIFHSTASGKLGKDCPLRKTIDAFARDPSNARRLKSKIEFVLSRAEENQTNQVHQICELRPVLQLDKATILDRLSIHMNTSDS